MKSKVQMDIERIQTIEEPFRVFLLSVGESLIRLKDKLINENLIEEVGDAVNIDELEDFIYEIKYHLWQKTRDFKNTILQRVMYEED